MFNYLILKIKELCTFMTEKVYTVNVMSLKSDSAFGGVFAHPFDVNSGAPIGDAGIILYVSDEVTPCVDMAHGFTLSLTYKMMPAYPIGALLLTSNGWANTPPKALSLFTRTPVI